MASFGNTEDQAVNVIIFGDVGSGKSSLVNLLLEQNVAKVSNGTSRGLFHHQVYNLSNSGFIHTVDTSVGSSSGISGARELSRNYNKLLDSLNNSVSLLVHVIKNGQIDNKTQQTYHTFAEELCQNNVPVILVVTHCEGETPLGSWYLQNRHVFKNYRMNYADVICGCCLAKDRIPAGKNKSQVLNLRASTADLFVKSFEKHITLWMIPEQHIRKLKAEVAQVKAVAEVANAIGSFFK